MRKLILAATFAATAAGMATLVSPAPAEAREIGWCLRSYRGMGDDCMYYTYAQCRASLSGLRGTCVRNPFASYGGYDDGDQPAPRKRYRRHHAY